jgi:hypothetical protein
MKKKLEPTGDMIIRFNEEELLELNIKEGDKFDFQLQADGSVKLEKYVGLELDMVDWPREFLEIIIKESCERGVPVNDIIIEILERAINEKSN